MKIKEICSAIAFDEGKKSQVSIGDIREIVKLLSTMMALDCDVTISLLQNGRKHIKRVTPKKSKQK